MKKIKTVFVVDYENNGLITDVVRECNSWVTNGEGKASIKFDGTSCLIKDGILFKRWDRKLSPKFYKKFISCKSKGLNFEANEEMFKPLKNGAIACNESFDPVTFHWPHWVPVTDSNEDQYHIEGFESLIDKVDGTYELVGPRLQGNPYNLSKHELWKHGSVEVDIFDYSFDGLKQLILSLNAEGLVWLHSDGRMAKLRKSDFGIDWKDNNQ